MNLNRLKQNTKKQNRYVRELTTAVVDMNDKLDDINKDVVIIKEDVKKLDTKAVIDG